MVFATWCHVCKEYLPHLIRVDQEIENIDFEYTGIEDWEDAVVKELRVDSLPTAVVFRGGKEIGRFDGVEGFRNADASLAKAVGGP